MIKRLLLIFALFLVSGTCYAHVIPNEIQDYIKNSFPGTYFRYDGTVILPNNTVYLTIIPAKFDIETDKIDIKQTIPAGKSLANLPDAVIFNNDFTLLKVIKDKNNNFALLNQLTYPDEIKSGIFPQNLFLPRRLVIPEGLESVKGKLESFNERGDDIKSPITFSNNKSTEYFKSPLLKNKALYLT